MLIYERIDVSEGIDFDKTEKLKGCMICHYWFFKSKSFNFETLLCNGCHGISMMFYELKNITIFKIKNVDYRCILWNMTYDEAFNLLNNSTLDERGSL